MQQEPTEEDRKQRWPFWLLLVAIFAVATGVTIVVGSQLGTSETTFPDLGDIASADPNLPSNAEPAPTFALPTLDGGTFDLSEHIATDGRPLVLNLWATWCPPCRAEMPAINTSSERHPEVRFVGVAVKDDVGDATAFAEEIGVTYTIAFDDGTVDDAYQVLAMPATFFIDGDGILLKTHFGVVTIDSLDDDIAELFGS